MLNWLIYPVIAAFLWAIVNHMDKYLLSKYCKEREIGGLIIFSGLIAIPVLALIFSIYPFVLTNIDLNSAIILVIGGASYLIGIIPYLYAMESDEASTVAPQMILITVFTLVFGYLFLGEQLTPLQLLGASLIILGSITISLDIKDLLRTRVKTRLLGLMLASTFLIAINMFLFKYIALNIDFITSVFWLHVGFLIITVFIFALIKPYRRQFYRLVNLNPSGIIAINSFSEIITFIGNISFHYSTLLVPLALAEVVAEGIQPFFVLIIGIIISKLYPFIASENLGYKHIVQKIISISLMCIGIILANYHIN